MWKNTRAWSIKRRYTYVRFCQLKWSPLQVLIHVRAATWWVFENPRWLQTSWECIPFLLLSFAFSEMHPVMFSSKSLEVWCTMSRTLQIVITADFLTLLSSERPFHYWGNTKCWFSFITFRQLVKSTLNQFSAFGVLCRCTENCYTAAYCQECFQKPIVHGDRKIIVLSSLYKKKKTYQPWEGSPTLRLQISMSLLSLFSLLY